MDGIAALLLTMIEAAKGYFGILVAKYTTQINDIMRPEDSVTHTIDFQIPNEEYEEEEDDD